MVTGDQRTAGAAGPGTEDKDVGPQAGDGSGDACRCKEAAKMTPRQLLGLMISDLAFWKKEKKG